MSVSTSMNVLVLGGTSGFGKQILEQLSSDGHRVLAFGRGGDHDLRSGVWPTAYERSLYTFVGGPQNLDAVVVAAYDRRQEQDNLQLNVTYTLFELMRKQGALKFCVVGDMAHHMHPTRSLYDANKRALYNQCTHWSVNPYRKCALFLFEPWTVNKEDRSAETFVSNMSGLSEGEFRCLSYRR
jgi:nucleoside-diphosphate-sugar epimerase